MKLINILICFFLFILNVSGNDDIQFSYAFPVPCKFSETQSVKFKDIPERSTVSIYSLSGQKIIEFNEGNNGKNCQAEWFFNEVLPQSDIYIYVVSKDNKSKAGKLVIIK